MMHLKNTKKEDVNYLIYIRRIKQMRHLKLVELDQ